MAVMWPAQRGGWQLCGGAECQHWHALVAPRHAVAAACALEPHSISGTGTSRIQMA